MAHNHLADIERGIVTKTNVIGIRKALNALRFNRRGTTDPRLTFEQCDELLSAIYKHRPLVNGELHDSGLKVLRNRRYAKRLAPYADIIAAPELQFRLVDFEEIGGGQFTPVYRATSSRGAFTFRNVAWQSGGDGPEVLA